MLLGYGREASWVSSAHERLELGSSKHLIATSIICVGEILALAKENNWGKNRLDQLDELINRLPTLYLHEVEIAESYANLRHWTRGKLGPHAIAHVPPKPAIEMQSNDLWIAATCHTIGAVLVSTDKDFAHLKDKWIGYEYVDSQ